MFKTDLAFLEWSAANRRPGTDGFVILMCIFQSRPFFAGKPEASRFSFLTAAVPLTSVLVGILETLEQLAASCSYHVPPEVASVAIMLLRLQCIAPGHSGFFAVVAAWYISGIAASASSMHSTRCRMARKDPF